MSPQELSGWNTQAAWAADDVKERIRCLEQAEQTAAGLSQLLSCEAIDTGEAKGSTADKERVANRQFLESLDWALKKMNGWGLSAFLPTRRAGAVPAGGNRYFSPQKCPITGEDRRRACLTDADGGRSFEVPCVVSGGVHQRPTLHLAQDMGAASWHGPVWLCNALGLRMTLSWDRFHRHQCDLGDAASEAGLVIIKLEMAAWLALRRGPWKKEGDHEVLLSAAKELFQVQTSTSMLLDMFYEDICDDLNEHPMDKGSPEHYKKIWQMCSEKLTGAGTGHTAKHSRWWSLETLSRAQRPLRAMTAMLLVYIGFKRKWWKKYDECPMFVEGLSELQEADPDPSGLEGLDAEEQDAPQPAAEEPAEHDQPSAKRVSVQKGREELRKRRSQCVNQMQYACRILCRQQTPLLFDGMEYLSRTLEKAFGREEVMCKTSKGTHALMEELSKGDFKTVIADLLNTFTTPELCEVLHIKAGSRVPMHTHKVVTTTLWRFTVALSGALAVSNYKYAVPPRNFILLASKDEGVRQQCLATLAKTFEALEKLEKAGNEDQEIRRWVSDMEWPNQVWCRENFSYLAETNFEAVYPWLVQELEGYGRAHNSSLIVENLFNVARRVSKKNPRHRLEPKGLWHAIALGDSCTSDFGRPNLEISRTAKSASIKALPKNLFVAEAGASTLTPEQLKDLASEKPNWPNHNARNHKNAALQTLAMVQAKGDWGVLSKVWLSLLLIPGSYVMQTGGRASLVLATTPFGFVGFKCQVKKVGQEMLVDLSAMTEECLTFDYVVNPEEWKCVELVPTMPTAAGSPSLSRRLRLCKGGRVEPLLKFSMLRGLPNLTVFFLKKLFAEPSLACHWERGKKPTSEADLLRALARHIFGEDCTPGILKQVATNRTAWKDDLEAFVQESPLWAGDVAATLAEEIEDLELHEEVEEYKQKMQAQRLRKQKERAALSEVFCDGAQGSIATHKKAIQWPDRGFSQVQAKTLLPPGASISKEKAWHHRWKVQSLVLGQRSKTFAGGDPVADRAALNYCLRLAWGAWTKVSGKACPWQLDDDMAAAASSQV